MDFHFMKSSMATVYKNTFQRTEVLNEKTSWEFTPTLQGHR